MTELSREEEAAAETALPKREHGGLPPALRATKGHPDVAEEISRLLIVSPSAFQPFGHQQSYVTGLGSALRQEGVSVHVVGWDGPVKYPTALSVHHIPGGTAPGQRSVLRRRWGPVGDAVWGASRVVQEVGFGRAVAQLHRSLGGPPVLFETFEYISLSLLLNSRLIARSPRGCIFHDTNFNRKHASRIAALYKRAVRPFAASILKQVDVAFVHADGMKNNLIENLDHRGGSTGKVVVLPYGAPHPDSVVRVERAEARQRLGLPDNGLVVLAFGTLRSDKCLETTVRGVAQAEGWTLLVAGPEGDVSYKHLRRLAERASLGSRLRLKEGFVAPEMHAVFFGAADVVVNLYAPSVRHESGTAQLARSYLRPTIVGGPPDLGRYVAETGTGWVVDAADAGDLARVLEGVARLPPRSVEILQRAMYSVAVDRSWERVARMLLEAMAEARFADRPQSPAAVR